MAFTNFASTGANRVLHTLTFIFVMVALALLMACGGVDSAPPPGVQPATNAGPSATVSQPGPTARAEPQQPSLVAAAETRSPQPGSTPPAAEPLVSVGGVSFQVEVALTEEKKAQGLSDRMPLAPRAGMLFVYSEERKRTFWMKDMRFPLDMIWISADCNVADITENAPIPGPGQAERDLPRFSPKVPVVHVLEVNAGTSQRHQLAIGDPVVFSGSLEGLHGC